LSTEVLEARLATAAFHDATTAAASPLPCTDRRLVVTPAREGRMRESRKRHARTHTVIAHGSRFSPSETSPEAAGLDHSFSPHDSRDRVTVDAAPTRCCAQQHLEHPIPTFESPLIPLDELRARPPDSRGARALRGPASIHGGKQASARRMQ